MVGESLYSHDEAHLLLVEDNDDDAFLFEKEVARGVDYAFANDIAVTRAETLTEAVGQCEQQSFDAVFLDLGLTDSNGVETVERFTDHGFGLPIIVLTGLRDKGTALEAIQAGAQAYLVKGESAPETIVRTMRHAIERRRNEQTVRRQRDQMDFFNSILRHDMLNGMQFIMVRANSLQERLSGEEQADAREIADWSEDIIDLAEKTRDILDTVTSGEEVEVKPVHLKRTFEAIVSEVETLRDGVSVEVDCPPDLEVRAGDLLEDVFWNLLTNAVEHTRPESVTIEVRAERDGDTARIVVEDDGPGIPPAQRDRIFDRGEKGGGSSGTGFGLYFVESMVETYDGDIEFEPAEPGARFVVQLPAAERWTV